MSIAYAQQLNTLNLMLDHVTGKAGSTAEKVSTRGAAQRYH